MSEQVVIEWYNCSNAYIRAERGTLMELHEQFSFQVPNYRFTPAFKSGRWDGWIRLVHLDGKVPVGLVPDVINFLIGSDRQVKMTSEFKLFKENIEFSFDDLDLPFEAWDHQREAVRVALEKKRQVILSPTSSGKSLNVYGITRTLDKLDLKVLVIVPSVMLVNQMRSDFTEYSQNNKWDVDGNVHFICEGAPKNTEKTIVVSTWQSLQHIKEDEWFYQWDAVIVDECHGCKATVLTKIMDTCINAFYRIGLSGSLDGTQVMEMALVGIFGPVKRIITTKELMDAGQISKLVVKSVVLKYPVEMADQVFYVDAEKRRKRIPYKNEISLIVKNEARSKFICQLANATSGNTLVLTTLVKDHGEPLFKMMKEMYPDKEIYFIGSKIPAADREAVRKLTETKDGIVIFASYSIFSTGVSIKRLHNVILASPSKSVIRIVQTIGRVLRLHESKTFATVFDIVDDMRCGKKSSNYSLAHFMERVKIYQKEQFEFKIVEKNL